MNVLSQKKLREFWQKYPDAEDALKTWYAEAIHARWKTPQEIRTRYRSADCLTGNRAVFNIKGNHYRLVVTIHCNRSVVYVRFVGTHTEYDRIDAKTI